MLCYDISVWYGTSTLSFFQVAKYSVGYCCTSVSVISNKNTVLEKKRKMALNI